ncbi:COMM domain-containing protein 1-like [Lingula anatina]|uniref:COMM domain-containing protein 1 n=1 Tax=Lingula anatina TaxID=7574 RepID=A0A1S3HR05_LINAN|nr:COMM domain-containing protein 1-like [Lingula anatina]|eukprot:XP_013387976.1 COMM domain-containing protein 1-like [Lingula anatina]
MADEAKSLLALLNGIARKDFYNDTDITHDLLKSELYADMSEEDFQNLMKKSTNLIKSMSSADMDFNQLEAFLTSQTRKKDGGLTEEQAKVYAKFWKNHKTKIHDSLVAQSTWDNTLKSVNWRIDIKTQAKHIEQINTPTAIVEVQLESAKDKTQETQTFEMDEEKLKDVLSSIQDIEKQIVQYCQNQG